MQEDKNEQESESKKRSRSGEEESSEETLRHGEKLTYGQWSNRKVEVSVGSVLKKISLRMSS